MNREDTFNNYIFFTINQNGNNNNTYTDYIIEIIAYSPLDLTSFVTPQKHSYTGTVSISNINYYLLKRMESNYITL